MEPLNRKGPFAKIQVLHETHYEKIRLTVPGPTGTKQKRRGVAVVELAVCFPVFMLMLLGIIEFGRGLVVSQRLTSAA